MCECVSSSDFGCYNLLSIVIHLLAQAASTPAILVSLKFGSGGLDSAKCMITSPFCGGSRIFASVHDEKELSALLCCDKAQDRLFGIGPSPDYISNPLSNCETTCVVALFPGPHRTSHFLVLF